MMGTPTETMRRRITWGDLDSLGIVFYPRYYEWIDEASHVFFDKIGLNLGRLLRERSIIFALLETGCRYLRPGRYHDEIEIITGLTELRDKTFTMRHEIRLSESGDLLVEAYEKRICIKVLDEAKFEAQRIPDDIFTVLKGAELDQEIDKRS